MKGCKKPTQGGRGECGDSRKGERVREEEAGWEEVVEEVGGEVHFRGSLALARPNRAHLFFVCPGPLLVTCGKLPWEQFPILTKFVSRYHVGKNCFLIGPQKDENTKKIQKDKRTCHHCHHCTIVLKGDSGGPLHLINEGVFTQVTIAIVLVMTNHGHCC